MEAPLGHHPGDCHPGCVPLSAADDLCSPPLLIHCSTPLAAIFLFGIEELGIQIEEPFGILPLEALCDGSIEGVVMDMRASYTKGHFGPIDPIGQVDAPAAAPVPMGAGAGDALYAGFQ